MTESKGWTVIYGTGKAARDLMASGLMKSATVRFASTNGGEIFDGQTALSLEELLCLSYSRIVVASSFLQEIILLFQEKNIDLSKVYWFYADEQRLVPWSELGGNAPGKEDTLYAFYDLSMNPSTFDAGIFAARAELERRRQGKKATHFVVVPSLLSGGRPGDWQRFGGGSVVAWRQQYVVEALFRLTPGFAGFSQLINRDEVTQYIGSGCSCFPAAYDPRTPTDDHRMCDLSAEAQAFGMDPRVFVAPERAVRQVAGWVDDFAKGRRLIVVTLREYAFQTGRNSNLPEWRKFLSDLDPSCYAVVVVRDSDCAFDSGGELANFTTFPMASIDINYRLALCELAYLNLAVNTGPSAMMTLSAKTRYLVFKAYSEDYDNTSLKFHQERMGLSFGDSLPCSSEHQKLVWAEDDADVIAAEFAAAVARLDKQDNRE